MYIKYCEVPHISNLLCLVALGSPSMTIISLGGERFNCIPRISQMISLVLPVDVGAPVSRIEFIKL